MTNDSKIRYEDLYRRSLEILNQKPASISEKGYGEVDKLLHEFEVYKVEIDMQIDELTRKNKEFEEITRKYNELADLHDRMIRHFTGAARFQSLTGRSRNKKGFGEQE